MTRLLFLLVCAFLMNSSMALAIGGEGATCNPSTANWPNCTLAQIPLRANVTKTVNIPGGRYATPYVANQANTEYILQGDMTANGTAISINATNVVINLNRHSITYGQTTFGEGIGVENWNKYNIAIVNGSIIQGAGGGEGDAYGRGCNPIISGKSTGYGASVLYEPSNMQVANMYLKYNGRDVGGICIVRTSGHLIEQCTIEDTYHIGTLKNRHYGVKAVDLSNANSTVVRNNTIINARQIGIGVQNYAEIYGNHVTLRSIDTNSSGIGGGSNVTVYNNTVIGRGEHPIGIFWGVESVEKQNVEIYSNYIDVKTTQLGTEYPAGNYAAGFRQTAYGSSGAGVENLRFYNNEIHVSTDSAYQGIWSHNGEPVTFNAKGRGLFVGNRGGRKAIFANNNISVIDKDGTGFAFGIACNNSFSDKLFFVGNTVRSNVANIVLSDEYGTAENFPLFLQNQLIKVDSYPAYRTISSQLGGYFNATGRFVDNAYSGGASAESIDLHPSGGGTLSVYFGTIVNGQYLYSYRYHDNAGASSTLLRDNYNPSITLGYAIPEEQWIPKTVLTPPSNLRLMINQK